MKNKKLILKIGIVITMFIMLFSVTVNCFAFGADRVYLEGDMLPFNSDIDYIPPIANQTIYFGTDNTRMPLVLDAPYRIGSVSLNNGTFSISPYRSAGNVVVDTYDPVSYTNQSYILDWRNEEYTYVYNPFVANGFNTEYENSSTSKGVLYMDYANQLNIDSSVNSMPVCPNYIYVEANDFFFDFSIASNSYPTHDINGVYQNGIGGITLDGSLPYLWYSECVNGLNSYFYFTIDYVDCNTGYERTFNTSYTNLSRYVNEIATSSGFACGGHFPLIPYDVIDSITDTGLVYIKNIKATYVIKDDGEFILGDASSGTTARSYFRTFIHTPYMLTGDWISFGGDVPTNENIGTWSIDFNQNAYTELYANNLRKNLVSMNDNAQYGNYSQFIATAVNGIMSAEIMEDFTIGGIFSLCVALGIVFAVLKYFAGG